MGILVICSYKPHPGREDEARLLMQGHVPLLRQHALITERPVMQGIAKDGALIEISNGNPGRRRAAPRRSPRSARTGRP